MGLLHTSCLAAIAVLAGCSSVIGSADSKREICEGASCANSSLDIARDMARKARTSEGQRSAPWWAKCAAHSYGIASTHTGPIETQAASLATNCTDQFLQIILDDRSTGWEEGDAHLAGVEFTVEYRGLSTALTGPLDIKRAQEVSVAIFEGQRHQRAGFGVPLALIDERCSDQALCQLFPPEGVFRAATAWVEPSATPGRPRIVLVIAEPGLTDAVGPSVPLAWDSSAPYAYGVRQTKLPRLAVWGLLGGSEVGRRSGVYLLEDYDPAKRPIVMIHGLGSSPLAWAKLTNAVWGDPALRQRYQVWHVVYQTNAPMLVTRRRIETYLNQAWQTLDPEGDDKARQGVVLVGHSMGGVLSRLLSSDSQSILWNAAFERPLEALEGEEADKDLVRSIFYFNHYSGLETAIFMASPHRGSPTADAWFGRIIRNLVGRRAPEMQSLKRLANANPMAVRAELRDAYQQGNLNSISTLRPSQPVSRAGVALMPAPGVSYHVISGVLPSRHPAGDGAVPLSSTLLPDAASTLIVSSAHDVYANDQAINEVLRILRQDIDPLPMNFDAARK